MPRFFILQQFLSQLLQRLVPQPFLVLRILKTRRILPG